MHMIPYLAAYLAILIFLIAVVARFRMFSKLPMHIRWELYPVAHEGKKSAYGGSYMEEFEWWKRPRHQDKLSEARAMGAEILFLVALREHNRRMWNRSFPFHFGLYLIIGCTLLLLLSGILGALTPDLMDGTVGTLFHWAISGLGVGGLVLGICGAAGLLVRRLSATDLKGYTAPTDIFNLVFFLIAFGTALALFLVVDRDFALVRTFVGNLTSFELVALPTTGAGAVLLTLTVLLLSVLLAYIPLTHMSHFVGKYFAYHAVRWEDKPNTLGSGTAEKAGPLLNQPVGWSAPHVGGADGSKTWLDAATENPAKEEE